MEATLYQSVVTLIVCFLKSVMVKKGDGRLSTFMEFFLDVTRCHICLQICLIVNNVNEDVIIKLLDLVVVLISVSFIIKNETFTFIERRLTSLCVGLFLVVIGGIFVLFAYSFKYQLNSSILVKGLILTGGSVWSLLTKTNEKLTILEQIQLFFTNLRTEFFWFKVNPIEYLLLAIIGMITFVSAKELNLPVQLYGVHDIVNGNERKGAICVFVGNFLQMPQIWYSRNGRCLCYIFFIFAIFDTLKNLLLEKRVGVVQHQD